jgi:hypothetical protein
MAFRRIILKDGDNLSIISENELSVADPAGQWPGIVRSFRLVKNAHPCPFLELVPVSFATLLSAEQFRKEESPVPGTAKLIHPLDLAAILDKRPLSAPPLFTNRVPVDELIEIDGTLYYQTVRIPAQTKDIK